MNDNFGKYSTRCCICGWVGMATPSLSYNDRNQIQLPFQLNSASTSRIVETQWKSGKFLEFEFVLNYLCDMYLSSLTGKTTPDHKSRLFGQVQCSLYPSGFSFNGSWTICACATGLYQIPRTLKYFLITV